MANHLPFEIGQLVESRCFLIGYRGAWFRCKIKDIGWRMGSLSYELEFVDFPDEKVIWTKPFQKPPAAFGIPSTGPKGQLMLRPQFPQVYCEKQLSDVSTNSQLEVIVVVNDVWKVGDLVDWWKDNCYWSGKIIAILGDEEVKVELLPPPFGEGLAYNASRMDLRPSLDWSPESGWMVPDMKVDKSAQCARVLKHASGDLTAQKLSEENGSQAPVSSAFQTTDSAIQPTQGSERTLKQLHSDMASKEKHKCTPEINDDSYRGNSDTGKTSRLENNSSSLAQDASTEIGTKTDVDGHSEGQSLEKMIPDVPLNSMHDGSLDAAIMDLEELIDRIKWIKCILAGGMPEPNAPGSSWEFMEPQPSSTRK